MTMSSRTKESKYSRLLNEISETLCSRFTGDICKKSRDIADIALKIAGIEPPKERKPSPIPKSIPLTETTAFRDRAKELGWKARFTNRKGKFYLTVDWSEWIDKPSSDAFGFAYGIIHKFFPKARMTSGGSMCGGTFRLN